MVSFCYSTPSTKHLKGQERLNANRAIVIKQIEKIVGSFNHKEFSQKLTWAGMIRMNEEEGHLDPKLKEMNETYPEVMNKLVETIKSQRTS